MTLLNLVSDLFLFYLMGIVKNYYKNQSLLGGPNEEYGPHFEKPWFKPTSDH